MANLHDDIEYLKTLFRRARNALFPYIREEAKKTAKHQVINVMEYGPENGIKLLGAIVVTILIASTLHLEQFNSSITILLIIFILMFDIFLGKGWIMPILKDFLLMMRDVVVAVFQAIFEMFKDILGMGKSADH